MVIEVIDPFKFKEQLVNIHNVQRSINCCLDHDKSFSNNKEIIQIILGETRLALATLWWLPGPLPSVWYLDHGPHFAAEIKVYSIVSLGYQVYQK